MSRASGEFLRFLAAGIVNTAVGYGVFLLLHQVFGVHIAAANAGAYAVALAAAYLLNKHFVFRAGAPAKGSVPAFLLCFAIAFGANQGVLWTLHAATDLPAWFIQLVAMGCYTVLFFVLNKVVVFAARGADAAP